MNLVDDLVVRLGCRFDFDDKLNMYDAVERSSCEVCDTAPLMFLAVASTTVPGSVSSKTKTSL